MSVLLLARTVIVFAFILVRGVDSLGEAQASSLLYLREGVVVAELIVLVRIDYRVVDGALVVHNRTKELVRLLDLIRLDHHLLHVRFGPIGGFRDLRAVNDKLCSLGGVAVVCGGDEARVRLKLLPCVRYELVRGRKRRSVHRAGD